MLPALSRAEERLLLGLADPEAPAPEELPPAPRMLALLDNVEFHGVLPIAMRKLGAYGFDRLAQDDALKARLAELRERITVAVGQSMLLQYHGGRIMRGLARQDIPARIVKGPVFAGKLYSQVADRPFTDIDILVRQADIPRANRVIEEAGFRLASGEEQSAALQEFKWLEKDNSSLLVELHGNLVHDGGMRRRLSLNFDELAVIDGDVEDSPATLLTIAVVHAAGGHKFHRLQLCVDVLQAVRRLPSAAAEGQALAAARMAGIELEFATVLNVTGRLFGEPRALALADRIEPDLGTRLARRLITPDILLKVESSGKTRSRLSRDAFRWIQRLTSVRPQGA